MTKTLKAALIAGVLAMVPLATISASADVVGVHVGPIRAGIHVGPTIITTATVGVIIVAATGAKSGQPSAAGHSC